MPHGNHRGVGTLDHDHRGDAVGRRGVQQRDRPVQELHLRRKLQSRGRGSGAEIAIEQARRRRQADVRDRDRRRKGARGAADPLSDADLEHDSAGRYLPRVRRWRTHDQSAVPRNRAAQHRRDHPAARGTGPPRSQAVEPRPGHRPARRDPGAEHLQDPAQRPVPVADGDQRPAGRLSHIGLRQLPRDLRQRSRTAPFAGLRQVRA